jgi:hypothetical protein
VRAARNELFGGETQGQTPARKDRGSAQRLVSSRLPSGTRGYAYSALLSGALFAGACAPADPYNFGGNGLPVASDSGTGGSGTRPSTPANAGAPGSPIYVPPPPSMYCTDPSFGPCGGLLAGSWEVEDTCRAETTNRTALRIWGTTLMNLDPTTCGDAAQKLTSQWSGRLTFATGQVTDERQRLRKLDVALRPACLNASVGVTVQASALPAACESLQDASTTCALSAGICHCTGRFIDNGTIHGTYGVLPKSVAIGETPDIYEYCATEDHLIWYERDSATPIVFRRVEQGVGPDPIAQPR